MGFKLVKINGGSTASVVQTNDATIEAVISNFIAYNVGGTTESFTLKSDGVAIISEEVPANGSYRLPDKFNIPVGTELTIDTDANVTATISVYVGAVDVAGALTAAQQASLDAITNEAAAAQSASEAAQSALDAATFDPASYYNKAEVDALKTTTVVHTVTEVNKTEEIEIVVTSGEPLTVLYDGFPIIEGVEAEDYTKSATGIQLNTTPIAGEQVYIIAHNG